MKRLRTIAVLTLTGLVLSSHAIRADVRADVAVPTGFKENK